MQITETPLCNIGKNSAMAKIWQICKFIVWDECTMAHKRSLEVMGRTLKDLRDKHNIFGGAMNLLSGDFRQTLPVIPRSTVKALQLTTNMQVFLQHDETANVLAKELLDIGSNKVAMDTSTGFNTLPTDLCHITDSKEELIQRVFPEIAQKFNNHNWMGERAILASKNKDVEDLNATIQVFFSGQLVWLVFIKSVDTVMNQDDVVNFPTEFLNSLESPRLPTHNLQLKVGSVVIMLRKINQPRLCNGTILAVKKLMKNFIEATIIKGKCKGEDVLIPRIPMIPTDLPYDFNRLQFPTNLLGITSSLVSSILKLKNLILFQRKAYGAGQLVKLQANKVAERKDNNKKTSTGRERMNWPYFEMMAEIYLNEAQVTSKQ
ncbi:uncharacterized protein LOC129940729 [Eupeodes corollae]|uniref:uncharacterized protein LOC129940729 n=1 Tax=Eupeodes corollae TaxID=290404 RepID=UPI002490D9EE|nr:uncharacterized protein LOC129940729 [Eupeodes corollae]